MKVLREYWQRGIEPFLFFGELSAHRIDKTPLTESDRIFIRMNKTEIVREIKGALHGQRVSFDKFLEDRPRSIRG